MDIGGAFNPIEAFLIGLEIEQAGMDLYLRGRDSAATTEMKNVFAELARLEEDHIRTFRDLIREKKENSEYLKAYDRDEAVEYISWLTRSDVFSRVKTSRPTDPKDLLQLAVEVEKNSILLYTELKNISKIPETTEIFERLLREEKQHYVLLSGLLETKGSAG